MKKYVLLAVLMLALVVTAVSCNSKNDPVDTTDAAQTTVENTAEETTEAATEESTEATTEESTEEASAEETTEEASAEETTEEASVEETTEEATTEEATTEEVTTEEPETEPSAPRYDDYNVPMDQWTVSGHCPQIVGSEGHANSAMVAAGGIAQGALLHQGSIGLGEIDLSKYSKVIIKFGVDNSDATWGHYDASPNNRIMLVNADVNMVMSPAAEQVIAGETYEPCGWSLVEIEIDLTNVDYNGPVFVTYDTLPGTFMLFGSVEFIGAEMPEAEVVAPLVIDIANTTAVATDATWIPNQHLLGPRVLADDTTGQINAINVFNSNFLGETGFGNVIVGGYISVGEVDLSLYKSVTLLVAGGGAGQTNEAWLTDAEGNQLNAVNASFTAGNGSSEGTQTLRTITIDLDTDYNGEVRFLFTQANVVTVVGITFNP